MFDEEEPKELKAFRSLMATAIDEHSRTKEFLEEKLGKGNVWDEEELKRDFDIHAEMAPCCIVVRKADGMPGVIGFQNKPKLYFGFIETPSEGGEE